VPLIDQMNPDAATFAAGGPIDVELSHLQPGQQMAVRWREHPIFIVNRPQKRLQSLQDPQLLHQLADPQSKELQQPPYARNWHRSVKPDFGVMVGICTHLGCIPLFYPRPTQQVPQPTGRVDIFAHATARNTTWRVACSKAFPPHITCQCPHTSL
jgi:ubiquinol-cytochrome c reductase iron-sulfur subunit